MSCYIMKVHIHVTTDPYQYHMPRDDRLYMMSSDSK